jgi:hypothetical protein
VHRFIFVTISLFSLTLLTLPACQKFELPVTTVSPSKSTNVTWKNTLVKRTIPSTKATNDDASSRNMEAFDETEFIDMPPPESIKVPEPLAIMDPNDFVPKPAVHIKDTLGAPVMIRQEGLVQVWQYKLTECVVDFFIYKNKTEGIAKYTDMRSLTLTGTLDDVACKIALHNASQK